ncbi:MAG: serine/threonine protein kinase, partial [Polyangiales bacterium]
DPTHPAWSRGDLRDEEHLTAHLRILMQVANALEYAHSRGVVHRDVKPENVMLGPFGEVYLLDWGIALRQGRARRELELVGTPAYLAPEMATGSADEIDARTDVYLLGATLHVVLTGRFRHDTTDPVRAMEMAVESKPFEYGSDVPAELAALCNAATSREKDRRPSGAGEFRLAISAYLRHRSSIVVAGSAQAQLDKLHDQLAEGAPISGVEIAQRMAECRFGFLEALRSWSGNEVARRGLDACLARMMEREIAQRNASSARGLLAEMASPDAALISRLETLEAELEAARVREEEAARAKHDLDASISWAPRAVLLTIFLVGVVIANVATTVNEIRTGVPSPITDTLLADAAQLLAVSIGIATTAKYLLGTRYNRRVIGVALVATITVTSMDVVAWSQHLGSRTANLFDSVSMVTCFAVASLGVEPGWWRVVVVWVVATATCAVVPVLSTGVVGLATVLTAIIGIQVARRSASRVSG